jgi:uncharacterized membrane protein YeaQ/YmgE (transglycosylase-associated protein family)
MSVLGFLLLLIIAAISGALGQALVGRSLGGWAVTTLVGFIGALLGFWLSGALGLPLLLPVNVGGQTFPVVWAVIGSALLALLPGAINYVRARMKR